MTKATKRRIIYGIMVVWPMQWLTIPASVVGILTLGYYVPNWWVAPTWRFLEVYQKVEKKWGLR